MFLLEKSWLNLFTHPLNFLFAFFNSLNPRYRSLRQKENKKSSTNTQKERKDENTGVRSLKRKLHTGLYTATFIRIIWLNWGVLIMTNGNFMRWRKCGISNPLVTGNNFLYWFSSALEHVRSRFYFWATGIKG